jgi:hypothetical protein
MNFNFSREPTVPLDEPSLYMFEPMGRDSTPYDSFLFRELNLWKYECIGEILSFTHSINNIIY